MDRYAARLGMSRAAFIRQSVHERIERISRAEQRTDEQKRPKPAPRVAAALRPLRPCLPRLSPEREHEIREMYELYRSGATLREVGEAYGLSGEWMRQLFHRVGLPRRGPGALWRDTATKP